MKNITTHIQETLSTLYPPEEIRYIVRLILSHVCGLSYNQQILCKDKQISEKEKAEILAIVNRLKKMEPLQYILCETEFYSLPIKVNPSVLIPRPETEELVDIIIKYSKPLRKLKILDIGTGSGCIPIALAKHIPDATVTAIDISDAALLTAKENASLNNVDIHFIQADILNTSRSSEIIPGNFDIIVSNPPYVTEKEKDAMCENVIAYEPHRALFVSDEDPILFYKAIADFSLLKLATGGMIYLEINANYDIIISEMLYEKGFANIKISSDLSGKNRFIVISD
jgi:protein-(glutamine-N5) methyltransferase, release factor-specific